MATIARWESKGKAVWVELEEYESGGFGYRSNSGVGCFGNEVKTREDAIKKIEEMDRKWGNGLFRSDNSKTPLRRVL